MAGGSKDAWVLRHGRKAVGAAPSVVAMTSPKRPPRGGRSTPQPPPAVAALPFRVTHMLTDRGRRFTAAGFKAACHALGAQHRTTNPYTPQTNGMVERFNGRIGREVLIMCIGTYNALERPLHGYKLAHNAPAGNASSRATHPTRSSACA